MEPAGARILLVEDEANMVRTLVRILERRGLQVLTAANGSEALAVLDQEPVDLIITDLNMPVMDGMTMLRELQDRTRKPSIIVLTGYGTVKSAVEAMKLGASDYLIKPYDTDELLLVVERQLEVRELRREVESLKREVQRHQRYGALIGDSPAMQEVYRIIAAVSQNKSTVLITGASGTGKELVARTLHQRSPWSRGPFVAFNCAAVSETLLDSQLFGHRRGSFTGAIADQEGVFQAASGGTLFLDEVSEVPLALQAKFLRAIQEREVTPLGTTKPVKIDVRLVAATNKDLRQQVRKGEFREDLFYRLNVVNIDLPPLRARKQDIPLLVRHFVDEFARSYNVAAKELSPGALEALIAYDWPGNIRELQNAIERAFAVSAAPTLELEDVAPVLSEAAMSSSPAGEGGSAGAPQEPSGAAPSAPPADQDGGLIDHVISLDEAERRLIAAALKQAGGNKNEAARLLRIDRQRLYRKLEKYEIH
ncbi:MAG TPA: sigma-54 dependent transcriptional regulator [Candidatus Bathyarchaeia archaeon]|nr:sigma-54 dependent transcriptional regulator [Candidatus Bathyarchaeia archaeon]